jgi:predicted enzyme related to lactoylglutathione lyase
MKLKDSNLCVGVWTEHYEELIDWYKTVLGFTVKSKTELPDDTCTDFAFGDNYFFIGKHDRVKGKSRDPYRIMIGFNVESVTRAYKELPLEKVTVIAPPFEAPPGGFWCMTIADPEGNILQFFGDK